MAFETELPPQFALAPLMRCADLEPHDCSEHPCASSPKEFRDGDPDIYELIDRGSLGTPEAKALRASVSRKDVERVLAMAKELEGQPAPTWVNLFGIDPDFTEGVPVEEWLDSERGEA